MLIRMENPPGWPLCVITAMCALGLLVCVSAAARADEAGVLRKLTGETALELRRVRGKSLKRIPPVQIVSKEQYVEEYVLKTFDMTWGGDFERSLEIFKALGMIPADLQAKPFLRRYGAAMTVAAYDYFGKRILFPQPTVSRDVLLHELVHACQDQEHDIRKMMSASGFELDRTLAMGALFEGEATNVQLRYSMGRSRVLAGVLPYGTLRKEARARSEQLREHIMRRLGDVPPNLIRAQAFVYDEGVLFVERLRRRKPNWAAVDAAYKMPPRSTTQILHPQKYIDGEWPIELRLEDEGGFIPGYRLVAQNTLGEFGMRLFLETHLPGLERPEKAVEGWRGDRVLLYRDERHRPVLLWVSTWETPEKARQMRELLSRALTRQIGESFKECVRAKRRERDVVVVFSVLEPVERLLNAPITRKTAEGRPPLGEEKKEE